MPSSHPSPIPPLEHLALGCLFSFFNTGHGKRIWFGSSPRFFLLADWHGQRIGGLCKVGTTLSFLRVSPISHGYDCSIYLFLLSFLRPSSSFFLSVSSPSFLHNTPTTPRAARQRHRDTARGPTRPRCLPKMVAWVVEVEANLDLLADER